VSVSPGATGAAPAAAQPPNAVPQGGAVAAQDVCPLCRTPLRADQDWCLGCGAAARTRLAAPPKWKGLVVTLAAVAVVSLAVLAVALVKLVG
jgi:hypothetical protein